MATVSKKIDKPKNSLDNKQILVKANSILKRKQLQREERARRKLLKSEEEAIDAIHGISKTKSISDKQILIKADNILKRKQSKKEEIANAISHGIMAIYGIAILILFCIRSNDDSMKLSSAIIYGLSVTLLFLFSCLYHGIKNNFVKNYIMKRFDHISIYLLIGGTYTPILLCLQCFNETDIFLSLTEGQIVCIVQ
jgi:predicted membrane channel-forming protein YqfA (hemolysin III family)